MNRKLLVTLQQFLQMPHIARIGAVVYLFAFKEQTHAVGELMGINSHENIFLFTAAFLYLSHIIRSFPGGLFLSPIFFMNAVDGEEAKAGKRAGNYGVCKGYFLKQLPTPQKSNYLSAQLSASWATLRLASQKVSQIG
jgi:hypothetical protein